MKNQKKTFNLINSLFAKNNTKQIFQLSYRMLKNFHSFKKCASYSLLIYWKEYNYYTYILWKWNKVKWKIFYFPVSFNIRLKSRLKNNLSECMQKLVISKIRIRVVHAKRIISHVFSCIFFEKKIQRGVFKFIIIRIFLYIKIFNSRKWKF